MYGYVNNTTGEFHLFRSYEEAGDHAREVGHLTRVTVREVKDHRSTRPGIPAGTAPSEMDAFLALGQ